jgi:mono/diheme cytochrome c family protein/uncharacterized membrane protein
MKTHRFPISLCGLARLSLILGLQGMQFSASGAVHAQANGSQLFRQHCVKCHGADGTGSPARGPLPDIPDFTSASWQMRRSEAELLTSILGGKGEDMPPFRSKIKEKQAGALAAYVRSFAPTTDKPLRKKQREPTSSNSFAEEFRRSQEEMDKLKSEGPADGERTKRPEPSPRSPPSKPAEPSPHTAPPNPSAPAAAGVPDARELFRQQCVKCHGAEGTGNEVRRRQPAIPDFTDASWQEKRRDAQLLVSILDGKGKEMPPWHGKISAKQALILVAYVRSFAPTTGAPGGASQASPYGRHPDPDEDQEQLSPTEPAEPESPRGFFGKVICWLGNFHPPAVHFPIALLTAAAVAELLRMLTRKPAFDAVSRFCVWFGTLAAVVAGVLGWFLGDFHVADASVVMTTHRWLGTSTVACAGLVLALAEVSRPPNRRRTRVWFRVTLLVMAGLVLVTGFLGGAVVYGLDHYTWPP